MNSARHHLRIAESYTVIPPKLESDPVISARGAHTGDGFQPQKSRRPQLQQIDIRHCGSAGQQRIIAMYRHGLTHMTLVAVAAVVFSTIPVAQSKAGLIVIQAGQYVFVTEPGTRTAR